MAKGEPRVDFHEANVLADQAVRGRIDFDTAAHRLYRYWETRLTHAQVQRKLQQCVDAMQG